MGAASDRIRARLAEAGRITFAEFMDLALYGPEGYYRQGAPRIGADGDFYTSPALHPAFGTLIAGQIHEIWVQAGRRRPFDILELGCGRGTLAADILHAWQAGASDLHAAARYTLCDLVDPRARDAYPPIPGNVAFRPAAEGPPAGFAGVIVANELCDALPVHRVAKREGRLQELYVVGRGDGFGWEPGPLSSDRLASHVAGWAEAMAEGAEAEAHLALEAWCERLAFALTEGVALLIDYGAKRADLLTRREGTLRGFYRHRLLTTPFEHVGEADITCHVDFSTLLEAAARHGLAVLGETSQGRFLQNLGMAAIERALEAGIAEPAKRRANLAALQDLVSPHGPGAFRVVALARGVKPELTGFAGRPPLEPLCAPALTRRHMTLWSGDPGWREADASDVLGALFVAGPEDLD